LGALGAGKKPASAGLKVEDKYPGQISVVEVKDYIDLVPFVKAESEIFLKTIIPSRKATRQFRSKP
jgi:hypothetical protein